jgi:hypothetical protein
MMNKLRTLTIVLILSCVAGCSRFQDSAESAASSDLVADKELGAYSTDTCHPFHVKPATQTAAKLPPVPRDVCHPAERSDALLVSVNYFSIYDN